MRFRQDPSEILKEIGIYRRQDIDLELVAFHLNADVKYARLSDYEGHILGTDKKAVITINESTHPFRQRFSTGHELGHWVNDRGRNLTYRCSTDDMRRRWGNNNNILQQVEARANAFSAQLLIPEHIFADYRVDRDISLSSIEHLAKLFRVSKTSMAIRFVESNALPCMLVCWNKSGRRRWFVRNPVVPEHIWPHKIILNPTETFTISDGVEVDSDKWISAENSEDYCVIESVFSNSYDVFTLIWWKNEDQIASI